MYWPPGRATIAPGKRPRGHRWLLLCSWPGTHLFPGLWLWPPVAQGCDPTQPQSSGWEGTRSHLSSLGSRVPCTVCSSLAVPPQPVVRGGHLQGSPQILCLCTSKLHRVRQARHHRCGSRNPFNRGSWGGLWFLGVTGKVCLAHRTRRRRSIGSSSSSRRDRGLDACSPRHPEVPLSPGLPTGWADSDSVRD